MLAQQVARQVASHETAFQAADFVAYAKAIAARGYGLPDPPVSSRVATLLKSPVTPGALADPSWSALGDYRTVAAAWLETLRNVSVFDALLAGGMVRVPLNSRVVAAASAVSGSVPSERTVKPISSLTLEAGEITPRKSAALIVISRELFELSGGPGAQLFSSELQNGVATATDAAFLTELYASVTPTASAGDTVPAVLADLAALLGGLTLGSRSRVFVVMSADNVAAILTMTDAAQTFPRLTLVGGEILPGVPLLVSDAVPTDAVIAVNAHGLAGGTELPVLTSARHALVQMDSAPDSPATASTTSVNLWTGNLIGLMAERYFGFAQIRANAVSAISGADYAGGNSP